MPNYVWRLNASTGRYIADVESNVRLMRQDYVNAAPLYNAVFWGDYSRNYPLYSGWYDNPETALANMPRKPEKSS